MAICAKAGLECLFVSMCINDFWMEMREGAGRKREKRGRKGGRDGGTEEGRLLPEELK